VVIFILKASLSLNLLDIAPYFLLKRFSPEEAIGNPGRRDFPIITGKEMVIQADFYGASAHAFTDSPREFIGKLQDVIDMHLDSNGQRAIFIATMNAVLKHLNIIETTLHCKNEEPEKCAQVIASFIKEKLESKSVGLIGLNPAIAEALSNAFGPENLRINDLNPQNIDTIKFGVTIRDGNTMTDRLVQESDFISAAYTGISGSWFYW
jgi:hypothetical protein